MADLAPAPRAVSAEIYFGCSRPQRKEIALRLAEWRSIRAYAEAEAAHLIDSYRGTVEALVRTGLQLSPQAQGEIQDSFVKRIRPLLELAHQPTPLKLLACGHCGHLTSECTCVIDGTPLPWNRA